MKWILYAILAMIAGAFFLPKAGSTEIRNLPFLLIILTCVAIYILYKLILLLFLVHKVKSSLQEKGMKVKIKRLFIWKAYIVAQNEREAFDIFLLIRRRNYCRYHFSDENHIELWKSTFLVTKRNQAGSIAKGATTRRLVGRTTISWIPSNKEKKSNRLIVMNKLPDNISDSTKREALAEGDPICASDITLFSLNGFINYINHSMS